MPRPHPTIARIGALALAVLIALTTAATASAAHQRPAPRPTLQHALDAVVSAGAPGAIALVRNGRHSLRLVSGYENVATRRRIRAGDRFRVGSVTKTFVATVVLQLAGEGRLALDDTVERWLAGIVPNGDRITVRQLLNHTSGLADYADDAFVRRVLDDRGKLWAPRELIALGTGRPPLFTPGAGFAYLSTGYIALGLIVEAASGQPLAAELRRRIFAPLHLRATSLDAKPRIAGAYAHGYTRYHGGRRPLDISAIGQSFDWAAGAIVSTTDDLARFYRALLTASFAPTCSPQCRRPSPPRTEVRARPHRNPPPLRGLLGARRRDARLRDERRLQPRRHPPGRGRHQRRPERPRDAASPDGDLAAARARLLPLTCNHDPGSSRSLHAESERVRSRAGGACCGRHAGVSPRAAALSLLLRSGRHLTHRRHIG